MSEDDPSRLTPEEREVIEAAKAYRVAYPVILGSDGPTTRFFRAVDALSKPEPTLVEQLSERAEHCDRDAELAGLLRAAADEIEHLQRLLAEEK